MKCQAGWITIWNPDYQEKYQQPQICRWYHSNGRKQRGTKSLFDDSEKTGLKLNIQNTKIMASGPIISWQIEGGKVETVTDFTFLGSKSLRMLTVARKVKDALSLEGKLWQI